MKTTMSHLGNCFIGTDRAYIYILFSKIQHFAYVGETNGENGVISRLCAHVKAGKSVGTLRSRLFDRRGISLDEIEDLQLFAYCLPPEPRYIGVEKVYRRGVEFLVQKKLWEVCGRIQPFLFIISHVEYSHAANSASVQKTAEDVFREFLNGYNS